MFFKGERGGGFGEVLTTSNPSFLILPNLRDLEGEQNIEILDQINYQIYSYHINKIKNYENANYSPPPYLILKNPNMVKDSHSPLLSSSLFSSPLLPSTLLSLQTFKHNIGKYLLSYKPLGNIHIYRHQKLIRLYMLLV